MLFPFLKLTKFPPPYGGVLTFYSTSHDMNSFIPHVHCARPLNGFENGKFPQKCQTIAGCLGAPFMYTTSDRVDTWLIFSGTTGSRQCHESTMVGHNVPLYHLLKCLLPLCHALFVEKGKTKY